ncbi:MAG: hypothetical protein KAS13_00760 [Candidatus Omnitrophica bacterium]|nr:hypothetical protein [Candidatus Omnitrophota bacterium]
MKKNILLILSVIISLGSLVSSALGEEKATSAEQSYNKGIDFYKELDYNKAIDNFLGSFNTDNSKLEQWINYNLGNAACAQGQKVQASNPQAAQEAYSQALEFFRRAIELNSQDQNAKHNYELTALKLEQAKAQQQNNEKQQNDEQQEQQQKDEQQDKQEQAKKSDNDQAQSSDKGDQPQENTQQQGQPQEMTKEQAKMLLENFQNSEDGPTGLRQLQQKAEGARGDKDW